MSTPITTYDKRAVVVSPTAPTSLKYLDYLWLDVSEGTPVLRYFNTTTETWEAINNVDASRFLTTDGVQTITGAKTFNAGTITVADITVNDVTIEGIDTIKLTDSDTHVPTSKLVEDTLVSAISGLETSIEGELATKANDNEVVKLTGDQIVQGVKEFRNNTYFNGSILFGTSDGTVSSFNDVAQYFGNPSTTTVPSTQAVANALSEKQNTLETYSETTSGTTISSLSDEDGTVGGITIQPANGSTTSYKGGSVTIKSGTGQSVGGDILIEASAGGTSPGLITLKANSVGDLAGNISLEAPGGIFLHGNGLYGELLDQSISSSSTNTHVPTSKAVYDTVQQVKTDLGSVLTYKGSVDTYDQLPEDAEVGDTWNVVQAYQTYPSGTNYAWNGSTWDALGGSVDLSGYQTKSDDSLTTTDKTIVGAINELSSDKQNTLKYYSESDSSTEPSSNNAQVSILENSDYAATLNLGSGSSNGIQTINIGGGANTRNLNIGTKICGENNNVTIGNASDGVYLTLNTGRGLAGTGVTKDLSTSATDTQFPTAAAVASAVAYNTSFKKEINKIYFNSGKINNDVFQLPKFPFTICVTCKVDSWFYNGSEQGQSLFQFGNGHRVTTSPWGALYFRDNTDNPKVALAISGSTTGNESYTSEYFASLGNIDDFLGKKHTIVAIARDPGDNPTRPNWNIYLDGVELTNISGALNKFNENDTPLNVPTHFVVNPSNLNFYNQPASANPLEIYDISLFDFDLSEEGSAYSVLDYANGKLIPPELYVEDLSADANKLWFKVDPQIYEFGGKRILKDLSLHGFDCYVSTADTTVATDADASYDTLMSKVDDHLTTRWIDKKASPQLYLERGVLSVPELANYPLKWPLTLAIEYELESLSVGSGTNRQCDFFNYWDVEWGNPNQLKGFRLELVDNRRLYLYLGHPNDIISTEQFVVYTTNGGKGIPTGKHTIVVCIGGDVADGGPEYLKMYLDGNELDTTVVTKTLSGNDLTGTRPLSICSAYNYSNPSATGGVLVPISIARPYIFNFRIDDNYAPYTLEDYVKGVCLPAEVTLGNPNFTFGSIYGNGWSTTDNGTKITVTSANTTWPALFTNTVPRGYCWKSVLDVNLTFSGNAVFEIYTQCKKAYIEVYDYSTGVTTLFSSAGREGGWGGGNPFGLSSSGHYKITIYGHCSTGVHNANTAIGPLSSGTITRTEANLQYTILAPESYTVTEYDQADIASPSTYSNMQIRSVASKVSTSVNGDELTITVNEDLTSNALAIYFPGYAEIENERTLSSSIISLSDSISALQIRAAQGPNNDFDSPSMVLTSAVPQRSMTFSEATSISGIGVTILNNGSNITSGTVFTIKGLQVSADTRKIIPDASGNNYTVLAVESGNIDGTNEYWTGVVRGTSDNALSVTKTALKKKPLTSLQFNVYGTDKKIIPGKYMRLIFLQDSSGIVTPTYISEEEWNDVYDV